MVYVRWLNRKEGTVPAYNFKKQFVPKIESGLKVWTIRNPRKNPTEIGDALMLYVGMRTKYCRKIMDAICICKYSVYIFDDGKVLLSGVIITQKELFAQHDGFEDFGQFLSFHKDAGNINKELELIQWALSDDLFALYCKPWNKYGSIGTPFDEPLETDVKSDVDPVLSANEKGGSQC
jgi:hypothetical protein